MGDPVFALHYLFFLLLSFLSDFLDIDYDLQLHLHFPLADDHLLLLKVVDFKLGKGRGLILFSSLHLLFCENDGSDRMVDVIKKLDDDLRYQHWGDAQPLSLDPGLYVFIGSACSGTIKRQ